MNKALTHLIFSLLIIPFSAIEASVIIGDTNKDMIDETNNSSYQGKDKPSNILFSIEYGRIISTFDYLNSEGEKLDNLLGSTNNHIAIGGKMQIKRSSGYYLTTLSYNTYAATGSDNAVGNYYDWKVNYLGVNVGVGYEFFRSGGYRNSPNINEHSGFTLFSQIALGTEFLIQGTQRINNQAYSLKGVEQFDKPFLFARAGIGCVYYASKALSVYAQYMAGKGLSVFNSDSGDHEKLNYFTHTISLGVQISLPSSRR